MKEELTYRRIHRITGWSDYPENHGTYHGAHSWFNAEVTDPTAEAGDIDSKFNNYPNEPGYVGNVDDDDQINNDDGVASPPSSPPPPHPALLHHPVVIHRNLHAISQLHTYRNVWEVSIVEAEIAVYSAW